MRPFLPLPRDRIAARVAVLLIGLLAYGASIALLVRAGLGVMPWTVLDQGLATAVGGSVGSWAIATGAAVLLCWVPLRQRPGAGTLANVVVVGLALDAVLAVLPEPDSTGWRWGLLVAGVVLNAAATGAYVGAGLGAGPRDGLGLGLAERTRLPLRAVRAGVELVVLSAGWLLGGTVGWGTVVYALAIGPLVHVAVPAMRLSAPSGPRGAPGRATGRQAVRQRSGVAARTRHPRGMIQRAPTGGRPDGRRTGPL